MFPTWLFFFWKKPRNITKPIESNELLEFEKKSWTKYMSDVFFKMYLCQDGWVSRSIPIEC